MTARDSSPPEPAEDTREWTLRWAHRQLRHYIDGPTHGEIEGVVVVPKSEVKRLRGALERIVSMAANPDDVPGASTAPDPDWYAALRMCADVADAALNAGR